MERQDRWGTGQAILGPDPSTLTTPWIFKRFIGGIVSHGPVIGSDGLGYFGRWVNNQLTKFNVESGATLNSFATLSFPQSTAALSANGSAIYIHVPHSLPFDPPGRLYRINTATMDFDWFFQTNVDKINDYDAASPVVGPDGDVVFGNTGGIVWRFDDNSGAPAWTRPGLQGVIRSIAFSRDDSKVFVANGTRVTALNYVDGSIAWTTDLGTTAGGPGVAPDGTVVVGCDAGSVLGLNPMTGGVNWSKPTLGAVKTAPAFSSTGVAYTTDYGHRLTAFRTSDGFKFWSYTGEHEGTSSPAVGHDGRIYFMDRVGWLYSVATDGSQIWKVPTFGESRGPLTIGSDGTLYVGINGSITFALIKQQMTEFLFDRVTASIGSITAGGIAQLHASDDAYVEGKSPASFTGSRADPQIRLDIEMDCPQKKLLRYVLRVETNSSLGTAAIQRVEMLNASTGSYETVDLRQSTSTDSSFDIPISTNASRFVNAGSGLIKVRVSWKCDTGPRSWYGRLDEVRLLNVIPDWNP